jgi:subtilisin-like proprotein convertase family protein
MKKIPLLMIAGMLSVSFLSAQTAMLKGNNTDVDTIAPLSCIIENSNSFDSAMYIPDGQDCANLPDCYDSYIIFQSYPHGSSIHSPSDILSLCINIEHSSLGDLQIRLVCPTGLSMIIHSQPTGGGLYLGAPYDGEDGCSPNTANIGDTWNYCWSENPQNSYHGVAPNYLHQSQTGSSCDSSDMQNEANFYHPMNTFSSLIGCSMNGAWSLEICDLLAVDDGWVSGWSLNFDAPNDYATGGRVYFDLNENCQQDSNETGISNKTVTIQPGGITAQTNAMGYWWLESPLPLGNYSLTVDTTGYWPSPCQSVSSFSVTDSSTTIAPCIGLITNSTQILESKLSNGFASIYPNPSTGKSMVEVSASMVGEAFQIYDHIGKLLLKGKITSEKMELNLEPYPQGLYLLKIGNKQVMSLKIIKD